jgi:hypothetical protein
MVKFFGLEDGQVVRLTRVWTTYPGIVTGDSPSGKRLPVARKIDYKNNPSLHVCNEKCMGASKYVCECSCGGKNHGVSTQGV